MQLICAFFAYAKIRFSHERLMYPNCFRCHMIKVKLPWQCSRTSSAHSETCTRRYELFHAKRKWFYTLRLHVQGCCDCKQIDVWITFMSIQTLLPRSKREKNMTDYSASFFWIRLQTFVHSQKLLGYKTSSQDCSQCFKIHTVTLSR